LRLPRDEREVTSEIADSMRNDRRLNRRNNATLCGKCWKQLLLQIEVPNRWDARYSLRGEMHDSTRLTSSCGEHRCFRRWFDGAQEVPKFERPKGGTLNDENATLELALRLVVTVITYRAACTTMRRAINPH
jgi:hypothetical protein